MTPRVICVAAARPNFMKVKPVLDALERAGAQTDLVHTGQHYDAAMSDVFFADLGLRQPDHHLECGSGTHAQQTANVMVAFEPLVERLQPDAVVVVGDVNSTIACGLVAARAGALLAHVEAGLRSRDWAMPEEINRVVTDSLSDLLFAPSADAVENLVAEGYRADRIHLVGNVMIDTLLANVERAKERNVAEGLGIAGPYGVVTLHRPVNVDDPEKLSGLMDTLAVVAQSLPLVFSVHPRTRKQLGEQPRPGIMVIEPQGYLDFLSLQSGAAMVLTDSGGIQEETTALGIPCLTLRESTERPITVTNGTNTVVGTDHDTVIAAAAGILADGFEKRCPELWDGHAGGRIAEVMMAQLGTPRSSWLRPTSVDPCLTVGAERPRASLAS